MLTVKKSGFTIVELLIVIVVIGVLAVITVVAFSGAMAKAEESRLHTEAQSWAKLINVYKIQNNNAKLKPADYPYDNVCLSDKPAPASSLMGAGVCMRSIDGNLDFARYNQTVIDTLKNSMGSLPKGQHEESNIYGSWGWFAQRGVWLFEDDAGTWSVHYYIKTERKCPGGFRRTYFNTMGPYTACSFDKFSSATN